MGFSAEGMDFVGSDGVAGAGGRLDWIGEASMNTDRVAAELADT
jgi:hypothetical protein